MKRTVNYILLLALLIAVGCRTAKVEVQPPVLQKDQVWKLVEIQGRKVDNKSAAVTLTFNPEAGTLRGQAACNSYGADYKLGTLVAANPNENADWCAFSVGEINHTTVQCPDAEMNAEMRYLARLAKCNQLALADCGNTLILGQKGKPQLVFELQ